MSERLTILVPVYDERATVIAVLERLSGLDLPVPRDILVVDDGSKDGTTDLLREYARGREDLRVLHLAQNRGKGHAIRLGYAHAKGTIVAIQDADLELDPGQIPSLLAPILAGEAEAVFGSRFLHGARALPWRSRAVNGALTALTNVLFGARLTDMETCYKVLRAPVARSLDLCSERFEIEPEITAQLLLRGQRIVERPVSFSPRSRAAGKKIGWRDGVTAVRVLLRQRFARRRASHTPELAAVHVESGGSRGRA